MDAALKGHAYVKSGIDMACWDILGKVTANRCVCFLGSIGKDFVCIAPYHRKRPSDGQRVAAYRAEGYTRFISRSGATHDTDIDRIRAVRALLKPGDRSCRRQHRLADA